MKKFAKTSIVMLTAAAAYTFAGTASAQNVLFYEDFALGDSVYAAAIAAQGWSATTTSDPIQFANLLNQGGWTHVVSAHQNFGGIQGFEAPLANYLNSNPDVIGIISDWRANDPGATAYLGALGFGYGGQLNLNDVNPVPGEKLDGLGSASLINPGWGIYSYNVTGGNPLAVASGGQVMSAQIGNVVFNGFVGDVFGAAGTANFDIGVDYVIAQLKKGAVPAPGALALLGLAGLAGTGRRRAA